MIKIRVNCRNIGLKKSKNVFHPVTKMLNMITSSDQLRMLSSSNSIMNLSIYFTKTTRDMMWMIEEKLIPTIWSRHLDYWCWLIWSLKYLNHGLKLLLQLIPMRFDFIYHFSFGSQCNYCIFKKCMLKNIW